MSIANGRLEIGQVDTAGGIYRPIDTSGVNQIQVDYKANIPNTVFGAGISAILTTDISRYNFGSGYVQVGAGNNGTGTNVYAAVNYVPEANPISVAYKSTLANQAGFSEYLFSDIYKDGYVSQTMTNTLSGQTFASGSIALDGFKLSSMKQLALAGVTTTGESGWIDNVKVTTTLASPTCTTLQVLQNGVCVAPAKKPPQWLKNLALSYEDLFKKTSIAIGLETTGIAEAETILKKGVIKAAEIGIEFLAKYVALDFFDKNVIQKTQDPVAKKLALVAQGLDTTKGCLSDLGVLKLATALTLCGANVTGFYMGSYLAPALHTYGIDPPSPDYQTLFSVVIPQGDIGNPIYQSLIDSLACAGAYLDGANRSYDRYSAAYVAGDQASQDLQFGAINSYLAEYGKCMSLAKAQIEIIVELAKNSSTLNVNYDPSLIALLQDKLRSAGFAPDLITTLQNMGLDQTQIDSVRNDILSIDPFSISGTLADTLSTDATAFGLVAFDVPATVPEPVTLLLFATAGVALVFVYRRRKPVLH